MENKTKNIAIITGASSGIGQEFAIQIDKYVRAGLDEIWLVARNGEKLNELSKLLHLSSKCLSIDLVSEMDNDTLKYKLKAEQPVIRMAVFSAGYGIEGHFADLPLEEQLGMVDLNCKALTRNIYDCLPYMRKNSRIILMASAASFTPESNFAVYAATKAYVLSLGRALNIELSKKHISVTSVCPGPVDTPFFDIAEKYHKGLFFKRFIMISPGRVVKQALVDSKSKKDVSVPGFIMKFFFVLAKIVPHKLILGILKLGSR